jgi:hypothetical protein
LVLTLNRREAKGSKENRRDEKRREEKRREEKRRGKEMLGLIKLHVEWCTRMGLSKQSSSTYKQQFWGVYA